MVTQKSMKVGTSPTPVKKNVILKKKKKNAIFKKNSLQANGLFKMDLRLVRKIKYA